MSSTEPTKKFVNTSASVVDDAIEGLVASTPGVALLKVRLQFRIQRLVTLDFDLRTTASW